MEHVVFHSDIFKSILQTPWISWMKSYFSPSHIMCAFRIEISFGKNYSMHMHIIFSLFQLSLFHVYCRYQEHWKESIKNRNNDIGWSCRKNISKWMWVISCCKATQTDITLRNETNAIHWLWLGRIHFNPIKKREKI